MKYTVSRVSGTSSKYLYDFGNKHRIGAVRFDDEKHPVQNFWTSHRISVLRKYTFPRISGTCTKLLYDEIHRLHSFWNEHSIFIRFWK
jgi:hypothetical protein